MSLWKTLRFVVVVATVCGIATLAESQQPAPEPAPEGPVAAEAQESPRTKPGRPAPAAKAAPKERPAAEAPPAPPGERVSVRVDIKIRAQRGSGAPVEKMLALVAIGDNSRTSVRTASSVPYPFGVSLKADVRATVEGRRILVALSLDYTSAVAAVEGEGRPQTSSVQNEIRAVLDDGKPLVVSDQVDAASDYRVTVEAKATILR